MKNFVDDILKFREYLYEEDDELMLTMKEIRQREQDLNITENEWYVAWMLGRLKKRKQRDGHELQANYFKYTKEELETLYMGTSS